MKHTHILLLALFLLPLLAACSGPAVEPPMRTRSALLLDPQARDAAIQSDLETLRQHVDTYVERYGELPTRLPMLRDTPDGVALMDAVPRDPWNVPYVLRRLAQDVVVFSTGPDLIIGSPDDIVMRLSFAPDAP